VRFRANLARQPAVGEFLRRCPAIFPILNIPCVTGNQCVPGGKYCWTEVGNPEVGDVVRQLVVAGFAPDGQIIECGNTGIVRRAGWFGGLRRGGCVLKYDVRNSAVADDLNNCPANRLHQPLIAPFSGFGVGDANMHLPVNRGQQLCLRQPAGVSRFGERML